jgi:hypothetical protein
MIVHRKGADAAADCRGQRRAGGYNRRPSRAFLERQPRGRLPPRSALEQRAEAASLPHLCGNSKGRGRGARP